MRKLFALLTILLPLAIAPAARAEAAKASHRELESIGTTAETRFGYLSSFGLNAAANRDRLAQVMYNLNNRPRKVLGCRTPKEVFSESVALVH